MLPTVRVAFNADEIIEPGRVLDPAFVLDPDAHMADLFVYLFNLVPWVGYGSWFRKMRDTTPWTLETR